MLAAPPFLLPSNIAQDASRTNDECSGAATHDTCEGSTRSTEATAAPEEVGKNTQWACTEPELMRQYHRILSSLDPMGDVPVDVGRDTKESKPKAPRKTRVRESKICINLEGRKDTPHTTPAKAPRKALQDKRAEKKPDHGTDTANTTPQTAQQTPTEHYQTVEVVQPKRTKTPVYPVEQKQPDICSVTVEGHDTAPIRHEVIGSPAMASPVTVPTETLTVSEEDSNSADDTREEHKTAQEKYGNEKRRTRKPGRGRKAQPKSVPVRHTVEVETLTKREETQRPTSAASVGVGHKQDSKYDQVKKVLVERMRPGFIRMILQPLFVIAIVFIITIIALSVWNDVVNDMQK